MLTANEGASDVPVFRKKWPGPPKGSTITLPESFWEEVDRTIQETGHKSRNEFALEAWEWAIQAYRDEKAAAEAAKQAEQEQAASAPPQPSKRGRAK